MKHAVARIASIIIIIIAALAPPAFAQPAERQGRLKVRAQAGLIDEAYPGWIPVSVSIENGGPAVRARVEVAAKRYDRRWFTASKTIALPEGAKKRETFYVIVDGSIDGVSIEVHDADKPSSADPIAKLDAQRFSVLNAWRYQSSESKIVNVAIVREDPKDAAFCAWITNARGQDRGVDVKTSYVSPRDLPDRSIGYDSIDVLVIGDMDTSAIDEAQRRAITEWVRVGGRVLLVPRGRAAFFEDAFVRTLLPHDAKVKTLELRHLRAAEAELGPEVSLTSSDVQSFRAYHIDAPGRKTMIEEDADGEKLALFSRFPLGRGEVSVVAVNLDDPPFDRWKGSRRAASFFLEKLKGSFLSDRQHQDPLSRGPVSQGINASETPSQIFVLAIVALYIGVVGPLNYAFLRRLDMHVLIVVTTPLLALLASGIIFASGYITKGLSTVVQRVSVLDVAPGAEVANEHDYVAVRSAGSATYRVEFDPILTPMQVFADDETARSSHQELEEDGGKFIFPAVPLNMWDHAFFEAKGRRALGGKLVLSGGKKQPWRIENKTNMDIGRGMLFLPENVIVKTPDVARGTSLEVDVQQSARKVIFHPMNGPSPASSTELGWEKATLARSDPAGQAEALVEGDQNVQFVTRALHRLPIERGRLAIYAATLATPPSVVSVDGRADATRALNLITTSIEEGGGQ